MGPKSPYEGKEREGLPREGQAVMEECGHQLRDTKDRWRPRGVGERPGTGSPSEPPQGTRPAHACVLDSGLRSRDTVNARGFKSRSQWYCVIVSSNLTRRPLGMTLMSSAPPKGRHCHGAGETWAESMTVRYGGRRGPAPKRRSRQSAGIYVTSFESVLQGLKRK